jgi:hypothetical protein
LLPLKLRLLPDVSSSQMEEYLPLGRLSELIQWCSILPPPIPPPPSHLYPGLGQVQPRGQVFADEDVGVVRPQEQRLQVNAMIRQTLYGVVTLRPMGSRPPAGLSAARGSAALRANSVF